MAGNALVFAGSILAESSWSPGAVLGLSFRGGLLVVSWSADGLLVVCCLVLSR